MAPVTTRSIRKEFGDPAKPVVALENIDLHVETGEMLVLVGPSGCGKTTLLRCIAGLETATSGTIEIGGEPVFDRAHKVDVPAYQRDIAMVFQKYALWPHMTVKQNVEYPLKARKRKEALRQGRAMRALETVRCDHLASRIPAQLSGGQQQRIALARAIASDPAVLLLDEPLSNLDALLRIELRDELRILHRSVGFTGIYVTHDQSEALSLGDRVAVMQAGRICQLCAPDELYDRPASPEVATFLGIRNRFEVRLDGRDWRTPTGVVEGFTAPANSTEYDVFVRPEGMVLAPVNGGADRTLQAGAWWVGQGKVAELLFGGATIEYVVLVDDRRVIVTAPRGTYSLSVGDLVGVGVRPDKALLYAGGTLV